MSTTARIWRYPLPITDEPVIPMPAGAQVLSVGPFRQPSGSGAYYVDPPLDLWALVDPDAPVEDRAFRVVGTGNPMPDDCGRYIGTTHSHGGSLIWHVFEAVTVDGAA